MTLLVLLTPAATRADDSGLIEPASRRAAVAPEGGISIRANPIVESWLGMMDGGITSPAHVAGSVGICCRNFVYGSASLEIRRDDEISRTRGDSVDVMLKAVSDASKVSLASTPNIVRFALRNSPACRNLIPRMNVTSESMLKFASSKLWGNEGKRRGQAISIKSKAPTRISISYLQLGTVGI